MFLTFRVLNYTTKVQVQQEICYEDIDFFFYCIILYVILLYGGYMELFYGDYSMEIMRLFYFFFNFFLVPGVCVDT